MWMDTHAHLVDEGLRDRLPEVLERARAAGVGRILCVAVDAQSSQQCFDFVNTQAIAQPPRIFCSAGIHPNYAHQEQPGDWQAIQALLHQERVVAIGETGLDRYWDDCPFDIQLASFRRHWAASRETGLPVIIHSRDCDDEMLRALRIEYRDGPLHGVMHSFAGRRDTALECIDMGLYISFSGILTYKKSQSLRDLAAELPLDRLLLETDAPYLSPDPVRSTRPNEPSFMIHTAAVLASTRKLPVHDLAVVTTANALRLFSKIKL
jgi:TatD DNase family protein